jgi:hypothetical protein
MPIILFYKNIKLIKDKKYALLIYKNTFLNYTMKSKQICTFDLQKYILKLYNEIKTNMHF